MLKKFADHPDPEAALRTFLREQGSRGGAKTRDLGILAKVNFTGDPDRARIAGRRGGLASKRKRAS